jgi:hypothetical protein
MPTTIVRNNDQPIDHSLAIYQLTAGDIFRTSEYSDTLYLYTGPKSSFLSTRFIGISLEDGSESYFSHHSTVYVYSDLNVTFKRI